MYFYFCYAKSHDAFFFLPGKYKNSDAWLIFKASLKVAYCIYICMNIYRFMSFFDCKQETLKKYEKHSETERALRISVTLWCHNNIAKALRDSPSNFALLDYSETTQPIRKQDHTLLSSGQVHWPAQEGFCLLKHHIHLLMDQHLRCNTRKCKVRDPEVTRAFDMRVRGHIGRHNAGNWTGGPGVCTCLCPRLRWHNITTLCHTAAPVFGSLGTISKGWIKLSIGPLLLS